VIDPGVLIDRLCDMWAAIHARVNAAGLVEADDVVRGEVWSHGGVVTVERDGARTGYAINGDGRLMRWDSCCGWSAVAEEQAA
jgi:hypothetical protein